MCVECRLKQRSWFGLYRHPLYIPFHFESLYLNYYINHNKLISTIIHHLILGPADWTPSSDELEPLEGDRVLVLVDHVGGVGHVLVLGDDLVLGPPGGGAPNDDR